MKKSSLIVFLLLGLVGFSGCVMVVIPEPKIIKSTYTETTQEEPFSDNTSDCSISTGEKITGLGTEELKDKTFYYSDYQNSANDTYSEACIYAKNSSEDYYLEYVEDEQCNTVGIRFWCRVGD